MNKYFKETLIMKALTVKLSLVETQLETQAEAAPKAFFKNVCTPISLPLDKKLESVCRLLGLSKARFIALAIESAIDEANECLEEVDVTEYVRDFNDAVNTELGEVA